MNNTWNSFLQTVFQFVKSLFVNVSKKMHRDAVVLTTGVAVVTVVTFSAGDFNGGGKNALVAFAETHQETDETETELEDVKASDPAFAETSETQNTDTQSNEIIETDAKAQPTGGEGNAVIAGTAAGESEEAQEVFTDPASGNDAVSGTAEDAGEEAAENEGRQEETDKEKPEEDSVSGTAAAQDEGIEQMEAEAADASAAIYSCSAKDYEVLLKIVQAEAGNCDIKGKILVANVVLNRVSNEAFPNTVSGVVYAKSQFSPVSDGRINRCKVTDETVEAVDRALAGEDYSNGALYFMNRRASSGRNVQWFDNHLEFLFKHGSHEFFK